MIARRAGVVLFMRDVLFMKLVLLVEIAVQGG
jgi:hypothetical protein